MAKPVTQVVPIPIPRPAARRSPGRTAVPNANISFYTWGDHFPELAATISADLAGTGIRAVPSVNKRRNGRAGLMLVKETPELDHFTDFDAQIDAVRQGIATTRALHDWFVRHRDAVRGWAALVPNRSAR